MTEQNKFSEEFIIEKKQSIAVAAGFLAIKKAAEAGADPLERAFAGTTALLGSGEEMGLLAGQMLGALDILDIVLSPKSGQEAPPTSTGSAL